MTFVNVLTLTAQPVGEANHISNELPESHVIITSEGFLFMSKRNDCQINSCLTPSLLPLSPYMEALHGSSTDIKGKTAHVIGARSACQTLLSLASSTWSTYYFSQCGLAGADGVVLATDAVCFL